jgi:hypothetical protein
VQHEEGLRRKEEQSEKVFTTLDAYLSGFLTLNSFIPKLIEQGDKVVFSFTSSDSLNQAIKEYNSGAMVEASRLAFAIKTLKSQIFSLRRNKDKWEKEPISKK